MQQRRLRLGDIVDDYCPRERRITNHAIVAMIEDEVKQTRCTTCDADHEYKQARIPAQRRKKESLSGLPADGVTGTPRKRTAVETVESAPPESVAAAGGIELPDSPPAEPVLSDVAAPVQEQEQEEVPTQAAVAAPAETPAPFEATDDTEPSSPAEDEGPVHRRLIRATLPRPEGQSPERKVPDFTMHQREANGNRAGRAHRRGPRPGQTRSQQGNGQPTRFGSQRPGPRHGPGQGGAGQSGGGHGGQHGNRSGQGSGQGQPGQHRHNRGGRKRGR